MSTPDLGRRPIAMTRRTLLVLLVIYAGAQVGLALLGLRFEDYPLYWFLHFIDPELLRARLLESVFYLHIQPPLFNLFAGLALKAAPHTLALFYSAYLVIGFAFYAGLVSLQLRLGVARAVACVIATLFIVSPSFILYTRLLFYTFPCAALVTLSAAFLHDATRAPSFGRYLLYFSAILLLCGLCSMFHLVYFALAAAIALMYAPSRRRVVFASAAIPFVLVAAVYVKNWVEFDSFTASTIMGRNLWIMTVGNMNGQARVDLVNQGKLSPVSLVNRFDALDKYPPEYRNAAGFEGIPALCAVKKTNGAENFNYAGHLAISRSYLNDAVYGLLHFPTAFLKTSLMSWRAYFASSEIDSPANSARLAPWTTAYSSVFYGKAPGRAHNQNVNDKAFCLFLVVGLPSLLVYALWRLRRREGATGAPPLAREQRAALTYCVVTIAFVAIIGTAFDVNETNRYRFMTDALSASILGMFFEHVVAPKMRNVLSSKPNPGR